MSKLKKLLKKRQKVDSPGYIRAAAENAPRITNTTVAEHREEVLSKARKYILPLEHSKHQVVVITTTIFVMFVISFFAYCALALYKFNSTSAFIYRVTQVIPFPVAKTGGRFVAYENYLFEVRRYEHYYRVQQQTDFGDPKNKGQLDEYRKRALGDVIDKALVKQLAAKNGISVSDKEVDDEVKMVRDENRLGGSDKVFQDVLKDYWGWSIDDFRRSLYQQMLASKVAAALDKEAPLAVENAYKQLVAGADFGEVAKKYSMDGNTKDRGGEFGFPIDRASRNVSARTASQLFKLKPGQYSPVFNNGESLEIVKNIEANGDKIRAAHIQISFKNIDVYTKELKAKQGTLTYIELK